MFAACVQWNKINLKIMKIKLKQAKLQKYKAPASMCVRVCSVGVVSQRQWRRQKKNV